MKTTQKLFLICGILAAVIYVGSDILAALLWDSYSYVDQSVSELRALGSPTRPFLVPVLLMYGFLEIAFGIGVWHAVKLKRSVRTAGFMLVALGLLDLTAPFFPMHLREDLVETGRTFTDTLHIILTFVTVLLILNIIGFGANAKGGGFRIYSYATIAVLILFGIWAATYAPQIEKNLATPWLGVMERINIYGYMLWMALLAAVLLRRGRKPD